MIKKHVQISSFDQQEEETILFWLNKSPKEKLEAVQILREQYLRFFHKEKLYRESRKGLRRFYRVTQRA